MLSYFLNYLGTAVFSAAYLGMLGGLAGLHARQMDSYGRLGRVGFLLAFVGAALAFVVQATSGIFPQNGTLGWLFSDPGFGFQAGVLLTSLGLVLMGIATTRAGLLPRWCVAARCRGFLCCGLLSSLWFLFQFSCVANPSPQPPPLKREGELDSMCQVGLSVPDSPSLFRGGGWGEGSPHLGQHALD